MRTSLRDPQLSAVTASRYVQPLREGGSLPAVVDTDDGMYVVKFRGAGQGAKALVAELIVGMLGDVLGLPIPKLAIVDVPPPFGRSEPDPEIQELLRKSHGVNVGLRYLDGAFNYDGAAAGEYISPQLAAQVVWFDAFLTNPDRSARNPNLMIWQRTPWLIDHGAALYMHHDWAGVDEARTQSPFPRVQDHVLLARSGSIVEADVALAAQLDDDTFAQVLTLVPDQLLTDQVYALDFDSADAARARYVEYLRSRFEARRTFVDEAERARARVLREVPQPLQARR